MILFGQDWPLRRGNFHFRRGTLEGTIMQLVASWYDNVRYVRLLHVPNGFLHTVFKKVRFFHF